MKETFVIKHANPRWEEVLVLAEKRQREIAKIKDCVVTITDPKRTLEQNDLSHTFYAEVANQLGDQTALDVRCECKLLIGVPILCSEDDDYRLAWESTLGLLSYERQLQAMRYYPVTREMTKKQISKYIDEVVLKYARMNIRPLAA